MGSTVTPITAEEYLNTSYEPDMDYVDGVLVRRNVGTQLHGSLQVILGGYIRQFRHSHRIRVFGDTRLLVQATPVRYRIPDVMVVETPYKKGRVVVDVPVIVIEIQSPEDTFADIVERCLDYESLAVPHILVMDPEKKRIWKFIDSSLRLVCSTAIELPLPGGLILNLPIAEIFAELDED